MSVFAVKRPEVSRWWAWIFVAVAVIAIVAAVIVLVVWGDPKPDATPPPKSDANSWNAALAKLEPLPVKGRAPKTGYTRDAFGLPWTDDVDAAGGQNGCETRFLGDYNVLR